MQNAILDLVEKGLSLSRAGAVLGIHHKTAFRWKEEDSGFADRIEQAESRFILKMTEAIAEHAKSDWRAAAELLARRFPAEYSKAETRHHHQTPPEPQPPYRSLLTGDDLMARGPALIIALESIKRRMEIEKANRGIVDAEMTVVSAAG